MRLLFLLICISFISCKKESTPEPIPSKPITDGTLSNATSYYGALSVYMAYSVTSADTLSGSPYVTPHAWFSQAPVGLLETANSVAVDSLYFNSKKMKYDGYFYLDTTYALFSSPYNWRINGFPSISNFTFTNTNIIPSYTGYASLPDTVNITKPLTINLTGLSGHSKVVCFISGNGGDFLSKEFVSNNSTLVVEFTANETSQLIAGAASLVVWIIKDNVRYFGGKSFNFTTELIIGNQLVVQ